MPDEQNGVVEVEEQGSGSRESDKTEEAYDASENTAESTDRRSHILIAYPADWDDCLSRANKEKADGIHLALSKTVATVILIPPRLMGMSAEWVKVSVPAAFYGRNYL
ncbi:MAG: hypothetical protein NC416_09845 [Eubacterium sp.]|nr:hypothetical protein [Eubacterium sp.]